MDIFLNHLIQFYLNNETNLHHFTTRTQYDGVAPQNGDRTATTYVTSLHLTLCIYRVGQKNEGSAFYCLKTPKPVCMIFNTILHRFALNTSINSGVSSNL